MRSVTEHTITEKQIVVVKEAVESVLDSLSPEAYRIAEDLLEVLNEKIWSGKREVVIRYVEGI